MDMGRRCWARPLSTLTLSMALMAWGCGEDDAQNETVMPMESAMAGSSSMDQVDPDYPAGPYGLSVGTVSADRSFYTDEDQSITLSQLHGDPDERLLFIFGTAGWCTRCQMHMPGLIELHESFKDQGLFLAMSIHENANYQAAKISDAFGYRRRYDLPFNVLADTDGQLIEYFGEFTMPLIVIIDLDTMEILRLDRGWRLEEMRPWIEARLGNSED